MNEAEEYEAWKAREIVRIKRDRENREAMSKEKKEIERVRNMTEEERRKWERKNPKPAGQPKKSGGSCRGTTMMVFSSRQILMMKVELQKPIIFTHVISQIQLERIRWIRRYCPVSCRLSTLVVGEG